MRTSYADSAQAREWDRMYDDYGRPRVNEVDLWHPYDAKAVREREAEYRKGLSLRIKATIAQMEMVCPPVRIEE